MLKLMRKALRPAGFVFFSAFCDESVDRFEDRDRESPLLHAYYETSYLEGLIEGQGWEIVSFEEPASFVQSSFLCKPQACSTQALR
jgi:hypothetical protein